MIDDHDDYVHWAAAYTLGALGADDRKSFERHLAECSICATEIASFAPLPGLIAKVEPDDLDETPDPMRSRAIEDAARQELAAMRRQTRRWRLVGIVSGAAAVVLALLMLVPVDDTPDAEREATTVVSSEVETAMITTSARPWGTEVTIELTGLPTRDTYQLWAIDSSGGWSSAATWSPTLTETARLTGATRVAMSELERLVVTSEDLDDVLIDARS